jgi:hypothetical protein
VWNLVAYEIAGLQLLYDGFNVRAEMAKALA